MNRIIGQTGVLALGTGSFAYLYHNRRKVLAHKLDDAQQLTTEICVATNRTDGRAKVPCASVKDGPLVLQLVQVHVMFRHGARTPLYTIPKVSEAEYDPELVLREHEACSFPFQRVSACSGEPVDWSKYEKGLCKRILRGGAKAGQLTSYGKDQMYMLGKRLRGCYKERLDIATYDPLEISVISSNIKRTVQSAQCVLAGLYGKDQLIDYAINCEPLKIGIANPRYNILIPNTVTCDVLAKNQQASLGNPDCLPDFKKQREEIEEHLEQPRAAQMEALESTQGEINRLIEYYGQEGLNNRKLAMNSHRQGYIRDPLLHNLYDERSTIIRHYDRFWANIINREPSFCKILTEDDMKALWYLRDVRVEEFDGDVVAGYRVHFYFDKNPFFVNCHIFKEVYTSFKNSDSPLLSKQTEIRWKDGMNLIPPAPQKCGEEIKKEKIQQEKPNIKCSKPPSCNKPTVTKDEAPKIIPRSLFHWLESPTNPDMDDVGLAFLGDFWKSPLSLMENSPAFPDPWCDKFHFVYGRDDFTSRVTHGLPFPMEIKKFWNLINANATNILFYAFAGQFPETRPVVSKLSVGPLITEMVERAGKVVCGEERLPKLCLYSGHDSTMIALLEAFGIYDDRWPPFGSDFRLELYREVGGRDFYVRILYNGKEQRMRCQEESFMHWSDFSSSIRDMKVCPKEYEKICKSDVLEKLLCEAQRQEKKNTCKEKKEEKKEEKEEKKRGESGGD